MPDTITLSESAVANLRFCIKGFPLREQDLPGYRELVEAGIMEPVDGPGPGNRFTPWGLEHGEAILERESKRIERARHVIPDGVTLSEDARALLRLRVSGERVDVTAANKEAYRELARAQIMYPVSGFVGGPEALFRFSLEGWERRFEFAGEGRPGLSVPASLSPSA